ncbi:hypothetical protein GV819_31030 [Pseudomonas sp. Fl5BN2]|uniref:hypothetical protein n=1 Tax=Pseudomonas sp. Fl5BN2 TaxID=2697652 RepID=UPI001378C998|nr:hypothetical protein [Pseudomonas sp. Fl5BN2]NBF06709.1 hypothetical protein [Pseudomonas sp. Fl5BN2]
MYCGIAIYDTENTSPKTVCELGETLFSDLHISITGAGYYSFLERGDHLGDHEIIEISFPELKEKIKKNEITAFRIYSEKKGAVPWHASLGYMTKEFGGFNYIDIQFENLPSNKIHILDFFKNLTRNIKFSYGIKYYCENPINTFYYSTGDNLVAIYQCERPSLFKKECPGRFKGQERYKSSTLRMVYPANIINTHHISISINDINLKEWILSNEKHGSLEKLNNEMWLWEVDEENLEYVNRVLGEAGILIAWDPKPPKKSLRKLP